MAHATGSQRRQMIDEIMEGYVEWREESAGVWDAYRGWRTAVRADAGVAFRAYLAALDREERASQVYAGLVTRLEPWITATEVEHPTVE